MSDTILGGNYTVYYLGENRQKRIVWSGSSGTNTMNSVYSALLDLFDESLQMDDGIPISAQTPVEYTIGKIDSGDNDPWYIGYSTMEHITGGALRTTGWTRVEGTNTGIVVVKVTGGGTIVVGDIGQDITHGTDLDAGTLLDVIDDGASDYLVIRPDSSAAANSFDSTSGTLSCNGHSATQTAASVTGEQIWANLYSIGTIESNTHIYLYQGIITDATPSRARVFKTSSTTEDWWSDGHIDVCVPIRDYTLSGATIIDGGYITVLARQYSKSYDNFEVACSTTSGGRNPIPLATASDLDNTTGFKIVTTGAFAGGPYTVGEVITGSVSGAKGIVTAQVADTSITYYPIDDPIVAFHSSGAETITGSDSGATATSSASPTDSGPALATWFTSNTAPTVSFTSTEFDVDDNSTNESYGIVIDCNQNPLTEVYEWIKYVTRRGSSTDLDGLVGEQYIGAEVYLSYTGSVTGTISEGSDVTQETSGATGIVIAHNTSTKKILLRNVRGTFATHATTHTLTDNDAGGTVEIDGYAIAFSPKKAAPLGTFAGGTFFGARGVLLSDWLAADENSFQLTPIEGGTYERPTAITLEVSNLVGTGETTATDDRVCLFRLDGSGGDIDKTEYSAAGGESIGTATLVVDSAIAQDVPGKTTGGVLRLIDASNNNKEYRIRYSSWTTSTFTLANIVIASADSGTNTTTIVEAGAFTNAKRGDLVYNHTRSLVSYIKTVDSANQVTIYPAITGQTTADSIELNCCPIAVDTADSVYVPLLDVYATGTTASSSIVYSSTIYFRAVVRNSANTTPIIPFSTDDATSGTDRSIAVVRTEDTIVA